MNAFATLILLFSAGLSLLKSPEKIELIKKSQEAVFNCQWEKADSIITELCLLDKSDPAGALFRAAAWQAEMTDREENLYGKQ
ncbi:MAG: hypothetical protein AB1746_05900, partial [Candidatus Zixiibacteriota bacterium]